MKFFISCLIFLCIFAIPVNSKMLEQDLNVNIGVFDAAKVKMVYSLENKSYAFSSNVETDGLFGNFYYFSALYSTKGKISNNELITQDYNYISKSSSNIRSKRLVFDNSGKLIERISAKNNKEKKVQIKMPDTKFDANDLQTIFAQLALQLKNNNFCAMEKEVYDGKKTYKISAKDEGKSILNDNDIIYKGETLKCSIIIKRTDSEDDDLLFSATADKTIKFWVAYEQEMPFIAKIEIDSTPLGKLKAYTTKVNVKD